MSCSARLQVQNEAKLTGSLWHNMKHETTPIIVINDRMMILEEAMNSVSLLSASPPKFPSSSSNIEVCCIGGC